MLTHHEWCVTYKGYFDLHHKLYYRVSYLHITPNRTPSTLSQRIKHVTITVTVYHMANSPGHVAQQVTCQTADTCLTADPEVANLIPAWSHFFTEIDHEIISTAISSLLLFEEIHIIIIVT